MRRTAPFSSSFSDRAAVPKFISADRTELALLDQLSSFLLEFGKGFAFVARPDRLTLDGIHFNIDLPRSPL